MADRINFSALTEPQRMTLGLIAMNRDEGHNPRTLRKLEQLGLIFGRDVVLTGWPAVTIRRYSVPIHVHVQWCEWCSRKHGD